MKRAIFIVLVSIWSGSFAFAQTTVKTVPDGTTVIETQNQPNVTVTVPGSTAAVAPGTEVKAVSRDTLSVLQEIRRIAPDREAEIQAALKLESEAEANLLLDTILVDARDDIQRAQQARLELALVNRTEQERQEYVDFMTRRLAGEVTIAEAPASFRSRVVVPAEQTTLVKTYEPRFYNGERRIITYRTREEIPPVLLANATLKRVEIAEVGGSPFQKDLVLTDDMGPEYIAPSAYAVSYLVNPETEITRNDILFEQGTTTFADAYSYDIVADLAAAMSSASLADRAFVIEGHASAEGDYTENLNLSQARAERIARELIRFGVPSSQLIPVGYGESNAVYPANSPEELRATDRRVSVFALRR